ncbi:MAG: MOSC domain-containing protein [Massilia sp.]
MARLLSVNVGLPQHVEWHGKTVNTAIWKSPVAGRCRAGRLNIDGDAQADLGGHGGEQRAVFVYQIESHRYWEQQLGRSGFVPGQFGENFTVEGLPDNEVCIGDRFRIGTALFEVTQPRVTCYRVGIRMEEPQMAALLTSSGRTGFYLRVIEEGEVGAGDAIIPVSAGPEQMTVADINALLYSSNHPPARLEQALRMPALSPGWQHSFAAMLSHPGESGNVGLNPAAAAAARHTAPGFLPLRVTRIARESKDVISLSLQAAGGGELAMPLAGQFIVLRLHAGADSPLLLRSYSLSGPPSDSDYRISVKVEPGGAAGTYLEGQVRVGDVLDASSPRGGFTLRDGAGPVVLLSSGVGATPVLAMLHALAASGSTREVWWLHGARNKQAHAFAAEARETLAALAHGRGRIWYSRPSAQDCEGRDYDVPGRMSVQDLAAQGVPREADFYLCGPAGFLDDFRAGLAAWGVPAPRIHFELFAGRPAMTPGVLDPSLRAPHLPDGPAGTGPLVSFARSGISLRWRDGDTSLLDLAEACDVPVRWSCRSGVCHSCESGLIAGSVDYQPEPLDAPATGNILICCCRPREDVVIDL